MSESDPGPLLPDEVVAALAGHLVRQRWFALTGSGEPEVILVDQSRLFYDGSGMIHLAVVEAGGDSYQLLIGSKPAGQQPKMDEGALIFGGPQRCYYDVTIDPELSIQLLRVVHPSADRPARVRPISAEQSNTSLVFDDRVIVKFFRRLTAGENPDVEVTTRLWSGGFTQVAQPLARWQHQRSTTDLAFAQSFLAGGTEGWALSQTSLRDFYNSDGGSPSEAGGDFGPEARRLGATTAQLHLAFSRIWGSDQERGRTIWQAVLADIEQRLPSAIEMLSGRSGNSSDSTSVEESAARFVAGLRELRDPGAMIRVHGDFHLGQVMRTDQGWFVLDFEGEPARAAEQRVAFTSPMKDVTGMLRSLDYASRVALRELGQADTAKARAWTDHNREEFLSGYNSHQAVAGLLPDRSAVRLLEAGFEMDKALYELGYEAAYRPDWLDIPLDAVAEILSRT